MDHAEGRPILWRARVHAGEYLGEGEALPLLSTASGEAGLRDVRQLLPSPAACHLAAMLINLSETSRAYYPLEPLATPCPLMSVFVERILNRVTNEGELVARVDIVLEGHFAYASITSKSELRTDVAPVAYDLKDGVWDIVLKVLKAIFPMHRGP
ncbi:hypothetical protein B0G80_2440 [Paraburkholderia sp. BL6669N2]|uniref:hypothetical protein n=1 Tax=Paraburkholderia sp. BL6669N2 TaxID=1938807 RepID=UPI000E268410|nr:hypothetical protein [Paraburkholderia sp. BL6669N2]REG59669.1 hypothetical protein B0G80_2440 [Paraburkholderia sp. BL6669N2]